MIVLKIKLNLLMPKIDINKLTMDFVQRNNQEAEDTSALTYLANLYPHERDERIKFDEGPHIYYIDGSSDGTVMVQ